MTQMNFVEILMIFCVFGNFCRHQHGLSPGFYRDIYRDIFAAFLSFDIHERLRGCGNAVFGKGLWLVKLLQCT